MKSAKLPTISNGFAMFSMFFGAGNITFPITLGLALSGNLYLALLGFILTGVFIPFAGLMATTLFEGDYRKFFNRIGRVPGYAVILILMGLIGPFGALPRLITLTHQTLEIYFTKMDVGLFSAMACAIVFLFSWKKGRIIDIIGLVLTPLLLLFLFAIVVKGIFFSHADVARVGSHVANPFFEGLRAGYNTMDLLASFFFSTLIYNRLKESLKGDTSHKRLIMPVFKAVLVGAGLLATVYVGFSYVAAKYSGILTDVPMGKLLGTIGHVILGPQAGLVVSMSIVLACLTTAIALAVTCSEFLQKEVLGNKFRYEWCLVAILVVSYFVASLGFEKIVNLLAPSLQVVYPSLLALSLFNFFHKAFNFKPIKTPVYAVFVIVLFNVLIN